MKNFYKTFKIEIQALVAILFFLGLGLLFAPFQVPERTLNPSKSYEESVARYEKIVASEKADPAFDQSCLAQLHTTGKKTEKAVVMFVGFTNCPMQMGKLGEEIKNSGQNVLILNAPHQGQKEKTNKDLGNITTQEIIDYGDQSVDIATGLGNEVTVVGLSVGGVVSSWTSENRNEVTKAVNIAPIYVPFLVPGIIQNPAARIMNALPFVYVWWDPKNKENKVGSPYAYNGFPLPALGKYTEVASMFGADISKKNLKKLKTILVINGNDKAVNSPFAVRQTMKAGKSNGQDIQIYKFAKDNNLDHDVVDPYNPKQKTNISYPILLNLIVND
jgi:pimeloyl-ACP methyl ester carboxylesterase